MSEHEGYGQTFPPGENWTPAGRVPNGKTLAHLMGCPECAAGFEAASAEIKERA